MSLTLCADEQARLPDKAMTVASPDTFVD